MKANSAYSSVLGGWVAAIALVLLSCTAFAEQAPISPADYRLGPGDTIRVLVFGEDNLTVQVTVPESGTFTYPFLGQISATGKSLKSLEEHIEAGLTGDYLIDPKVTVSIVTYRNIYVSGEVNRPGGFPFQPGLTVQKAIALAQGFTPRASRKSIYVISESNGNDKEREVSLNTPIRPGDIITVGQSFF